MEFGLHLIGTIKLMLGNNCNSPGKPVLLDSFTPLLFQLLNFLFQNMIKVHKIFNGRKQMPDDVMRAGTIMGGKAALAEKLKKDHAWNGRSLIAAPSAVLEAGAIVDNYWSILGELKDLSFGANLLWLKGNKDMKVNVKMEDLSMFDFKEGNLSEWLDRKELEVVFSLGDGEEVSYEEVADKYGAMEFCLRLLVVPTSHLGASIWVGASPYSKEDLKNRLGNDASSHLTPHITLPIHEAMPHGVTTAGRAAHAVFSRQELSSDGYGFGVYPWLECSAEGEEGVILPSSDEYKESTLLFLRQATASAVTTTPKTMENRMEALAAGKPAMPANPPQVFPEFVPSEEAPGALAGWSNDHAQ